MGTRVALAWVIIMVLGSPQGIQAELWRCKRPIGTVLFSDHGGAGCRKLDESKDLPLLKHTPSLGSMSEKSEEIPRTDRSDTTTSAPKVPSVMPFPTVTRTVVSLAVVHHMSEEEKARGKAYKPELGDYTFVELNVSHIPEGGGPKVAADRHFGGDAQAALRTAVSAAVKATHYDPRFIKVDLVLPTNYLNIGVGVDGPSAGVGWAVAVVSAILGDPLRSDICMTGTISSNLMVGPIGGLEKKIDGCHNIKRQEIIFPAGQKTFNVADKGQGHAVKLTEVATLAEAYQAATGQPLRPAQ